MSADDPVTNVISLHDWRMEEASLINERITSTHRPSVKIRNYLSKIIHCFVNLTYSFDFKKIIKLLLRQTNKIDSTYYLHFICAWMQMFHRKMISSRKNEPQKLGFLVEF